MADRRIAFVAGSALIASVAGAQTVADERRALAEARIQATAAERRAAQLEQQAVQTRDRSDRTLAESAAVAARIQSAEARITTGEARVRLIERLQQAQQARLAVQQAPVARLLAALQAMARRPSLLVLARPGSVRDIVHTRAALAAIAPAIDRRTASLRADLERARALRADAARAVTALEASREGLRAERARLVQLAARQRAESRRLALDALAQQDRAIAMGEEAKDISTLINRFSQEARREARLAELPGPLLRPPVPGTASVAPPELPATGTGRLAYRLPAAGRIVAGLGEASAGGVRSKGLTLATRPGAQIVAPAAGRVVFAAPYRGYGRIVILDHGNGWTSLITNLAVLDAGVADRVLQGSPIGRAPSRNPAVTVELRRDGEAVDIGGLIG